MQKEKHTKKKQHHVVITECMHVSIRWTYSDTIRRDSPCTTKLSRTANYQEMEMIRRLHPPC